MVLALAMDEIAKGDFGIRDVGPLGFLDNLEQDLVNGPKPWRCPNLLRIAGYPLKSLIMRPRVSRLFPFPRLCVGTHVGIALCAATAIKCTRGDEEPNPSIRGKREVRRVPYPLPIYPAGVAPVGRMGIVQKPS